MKLKEFSNKSVLFITGAGVSVGSGLDCYWGDGGIYEESDFDVTKLISQQNLENNPSVIWNFLKPMIDKIGEVECCISHKKIAQIQAECKRSMVFTQQVDNLHCDAGSKNVIEIHGNITKTKCFNCSAVFGRMYEDRKTSNLDFSYLTKEGSPKCSKCGAGLKPNIVPFNGMIDLDYLVKVDDFISEGRVDFIFIVGTQLHFDYMIYPVIDSYKRYGTKIFYVNPNSKNEKLENLGVEFSYVAMDSDSFFSEII